MRLARRGLTVALMALFAGFGVFAWKQLTTHAGPEVADNAASLARLHATTLPDVNGKPVRIGDWTGKVLIVNFWATWCPPCRKEMPAFSRIQKKFAAKNVQFVGIGIDSPNAIKEFAVQFPVSYPLLVAGSEGLELSRGLGNTRGALPHTVIFGANGEQVLARLGVIEEAELDALLTRLTGS